MLSPKLKQLNEQRNQNIVNDFNSGLNTYELAEKYFLALITIQSILRKKLGRRRIYYKTCKNGDEKPKYKNAMCRECWNAYQRQYTSTHKRRRAA